MNGSNLNTSGCLSIGYNTKLKDVLMSLKLNNRDMELNIGTKIRIGEKYAIEYGFKANEIIELIEGEFDEDNGYYCYTSTAAAIWNEDACEFDSIYHLFGNDLENFMDCEILTTQKEKG